MATQLPDESILPLDALEDVKANSGHNVHADCDVGRVCQLDTVLGEGSSHRSHAEWDNVHGATYTIHLKNFRFAYRKP